MEKERVEKENARKDRLAELEVEIANLIKDRDEAEGLYDYY